MSPEPESSVSYEMLEDLENEFQQVELDLIRHQAKLSNDLYAKREKIVAEIARFWPLVFEASPPDIDEYIQPSDAALLLGNLKSLSVERFELQNGDPRSIAIRFEFGDNEHFEDKVLEKKFWWRHAKDGWSGLVSEPIDIKWKSEAKDLTGGMLGLARRVWQEDCAGKKEVETEAKKQLKDKMSRTGLGGVSFFAWFGFRGRDVSAAENTKALKAEQEKRQARKEGKAKDQDENDGHDQDAHQDDEYNLEIFPTADDLAIAIAEDLWPNAIKYFTQAQEQDVASDAWFESDGGEEEQDEANGQDEDGDEDGDGYEDEDEDEEDEADQGPPQKKRKA
ncbi:hypothetical protein CDD82_6939 [Ophiocordyceps australis]|uniref:Nucleosome assembly protein n=1 Tax=Ophiocordyceps australis TaxID=1399860 RepID=A0A2C5ZJF4_9HYPO|nr:hypothetical protein CDD82_6939 [Ophiocordyceps australis]